MLGMLKAQSAMEYLMTYGWAILIIAVVLGALFSLGVFSGGALLGTSCVAGPGYLCSSLVLGSNGNLSLTFGQSTGSAIYNVGMACAASATSGGLPNPATATVYMTSGGAATATPANGPAIGALTLQSGQSVSVSALKCFGAALTALTSANSPIGTPFSGGVWLNYTLSSGAPSGSNPMLTTKFATISAKVV